ncbi:MAG: hypothetical protein RR902_03825, partial [Oscillospiraceae bacterium]
MNIIYPPTAHHYLKGIVILSKAKNLTPCFPTSCHSERSEESCPRNPTSCHSERSEESCPCSPTSCHSERSEES